MRTLATIAPLAALWLTGAAAPARAETNRHELSIGGSARALRSSSANALTDRNLGGASLGIARDLGISPVPGAGIWLEAGVVTGTAEGTMFQSLSTSLTALELTGGLRARYPLHRLIVASARVDVGAQRVRLDITGSGTTASDTGWGPVASTGAALDLFAKTTAPFGFGLRLEVGYVVTPGLSLTPHREVPDDMLTLEMTDFSLGKLDLGGPTFAASFIGQF